MENLGQFIKDLFEKDKKRVQAYRNSALRSNTVFELAELEKYAVTFFEKNNNQDLVYHNLNHTQNVVFHARQIANHYALKEEELLIVECAAWFHDTGYLIRNDPSGHELLGADLAERFLKNHNLSAKIIAGVRGCIMATVLPQKPQTLLEKIICDADLYHFGMADLFFHDALMHEEVNQRIRKPVDACGWTEGTISLLNAHSYHTLYCQNLLNQQKRFNINKLEVTLKEFCF